MSEELDNSVDGELNKDEFEIEEDGLIAFGGLTQTGFMTLGITIWVHGQMITGLMVDPLTYLEAVARRFKNATGNHAGVFSNAFSNAVAEGRKEFDAIPDKSNGTMGEFIYLIDVSILRPDGSWIDLHDIPWKGRVSSIDGFVYGSIR